MYVKERVEIFADELVQRMHDDGLPRNIVNLKLYACRGGKEGADSYGNPTKSFAQRLASCMRSVGYTDISLTAYTEPLIASAVKASSQGHKQTEKSARSSTVAKKF